MVARCVALELEPGVAPEAVQAAEVVGPAGAVALVVAEAPREAPRPLDMPILALVGVACASMALVVESAQAASMM